MTINRFLLKITEMQISAFNEEIKKKLKEYQEKKEINIDDICALRNILRGLEQQKEELETKVQIEQEEAKINGENKL